jgi:hypothetical protein
MTEFSDDPLDHLSAQIRDYSPNSLPLLQLMCDQCGRQTAFYAAFVLICLQASTEKGVTKPLGEYRSYEFQDFAFFEVAKTDERALVMFADLLRTYQHDRVTIER